MVARLPYPLLLLLPVLCPDLTESPLPLPPRPPPLLLLRESAAGGEGVAVPIPPTAAATEADPVAEAEEPEKKDEEEDEEEECSSGGGGYRANRRDSGDFAARMQAMTSCKPLDLSSGTPLIAVKQSSTSTRPVDSRMPLLPSDPRGKAFIKI